MNHVTRILSAIEAGDPTAAGRLLPLVYAELRALAARKLAREPGGQTLQATALVHEAYLRLVGGDQESQRWENRGHFFIAAAESMRRILVEQARRKRRLKYGGEFARQALDEIPIEAPDVRDDLLALDAALTKLASANEKAAALVHLRYFAGMTLLDAGTSLGVSRRSAARLWTLARAWLLREMRAEPRSPDEF